MTLGGMNEKQDLRMSSSFLVGKLHNEEKSWLEDEKINLIWDVT